MPLQDLLDVGSGDLQRDEHLDPELVARGRDELRWRAQPVAELTRPFASDPVALLRALAFAVVGLDESVTFEALQRRVHLADVQRPHLAGARLEFVLQPETVLWPVAQ